MESDRKPPTHPRVLYVRVAWVKHTPFIKTTGRQAVAPTVQGSSSYVTHLFVISPRAYIPHYNTMAILVNIIVSLLKESACILLFGFNGMFLVLELVALAPLLRLSKFQCLL